MGQHNNIKMFAQKLLPALAVFSVAAAQTSTICSQPTVTVNSQADASQLSDCSTVSGSIVIGSTASGTIAIDGPQQVRGNLTSQIANNTALHAIAFPALTSVAGAIDFSGNFTTPELPKLEDVKGGFNIQSQQAITCSGFEEQSGGKGSIIQGKFICKSATATTETLDGSASTTGGSSGSSATPKSDATNFGLSQAALGASFIGGLLQMILESIGTSAFFLSLPYLRPNLPRSHCLFLITDHQQNEASHQLSVLCDLH